MNKYRYLGRKWINVIFMFVFTIYAGSSFARDVTQLHSITDAMNTITAESLMQVQFYFGDQPYPKSKRSIGRFTTRRTTIAFGKTDYNSCQWAFLSAVKTLFERAQIEGGNAVVNIQSVTDGEAFISNQQFVCRAGNVVSKVYLSGDVVFQ